MAARRKPDVDNLNEAKRRRVRPSQKLFLTCPLGKDVDHSRFSDLKRSTTLPSGSTLACAHGHIVSTCYEQDVNMCVDIVKRIACKLSNKSADCLAVTVSPYAAPTEEYHVFYLQSVVPALFFSKCVENCAYGSGFEVISVTGPFPVPEAQIAIRSYRTSAFNLAIRGLNVPGEATIPVFVYDSSGRPLMDSPAPPPPVRMSTTRASQTPPVHVSPLDESSEGPPPLLTQKKKRPKRTRKRRVLQCFRCQGFGHALEGCVKPVACRICAGPHMSSACTVRARPELLKCSNCLGPHPSSSPKCPKLPRPSQPHQRSKQQQSPRRPSQQPVLLQFMQLMTTLVKDLNRPKKRRPRKRTATQPST